MLCSLALNNCHEPASQACLVALSIHAGAYLNFCRSLICSEAPQPLYYPVRICFCQIAGAHPGCDTPAYCYNPHHLSCSRERHFRSGLSAGHSEQLRKLLPLAMEHALL